MSFRSVAASGFFARVAFSSLAMLAMAASLTAVPISWPTSHSELHKNSFAPLFASVRDLVIETSSTELSHMSVPEPAMLALFGFGLIGLAGRLRRR